MFRHLPTNQHTSSPQAGRPATNTLTKENCKVKRCYSLKRNKTFRYVYRKGKSVPSRMLVMIYNKSKTGMVKVGFSVSKKIGNSVTRNRVKRRLREAFRPLIPEIMPGYDIIFIARDAVVEAEFDSIGRSMYGMLRKATLLKKQNEQN